MRRRKRSDVASPVSHEENDTELQIVEAAIHVEEERQCFQPHQVTLATRLMMLTIRLDLNETVTHLQIEPAASQRLPNNVSPSKPGNINSSFTAVETPPTTAIVDDEHSTMILMVALE